MKLAVKLKSFIGVGVFAMSLLAANANANTFDSAIRNLTGSSFSSSTSSGAYASRTRSGYGFGSHRARVGHKTYSLVSIDPPNISAGCSGIDFHMGGISWLNKGQIEQMLKTIAEGAGYVVFNLVLSSLFPDLQKNLAKAVEFAQRMNNLSIDSCAASTALASSAVYAAGSAWKGAAGDNKWLGSGAAGRMTSEAGEALSDSCNSLASGLLGPSSRSDHWLSAAMDVCDSPSKAVKEVESQIANSDIPQKFFDMSGNAAWNALTSLGYGARQGDFPTGRAPAGSLMEKYFSSSHYRELRQGFNNDTKYLKAQIGMIIHSMYGTSHAPYNEDEEGAEGREGGTKAKDEEDVYGPLTARDAMSVMLCGHPSNITDNTAGGEGIKEQLSNEVNAVCMGLYGMSEPGDIPKISFLECETEDCSYAGKNNRNLTECTYGGGANACVSTAFSQDNYLGSDFQGMFRIVAKELEEAVKIIAKNEEKLNEFQKHLIVAAPFPLYQAINLAAIQPELSTNILVGNSNILAVMIVGSLLEHAASEMMSQLSDSRIPKRLAGQMIQIASELNSLGESHYDDLLKLYTTQNEIMERVNTANRAIMMSSYASGITGVDFAQAIAN